MSTGHTDSPTPGSPDPASPDTTAADPAAETPDEPDHDSHKHSRNYLLILSLAALGVVYGDIGTSPIYALRESFGEHYGLAASPANVLGILSLIFWALIIVISVKYLMFVMRADNRGEGGMIALTALVAPPSAEKRRPRGILVLIGLFGAALLYGDSMITPAISVLSAIEGLEVATPFFEHYIIPITVTILVALFAIQFRGTGGIGKVFGPITLIWFLTLAALGFAQVVRHPQVLASVNPLYGIDFFQRNGLAGFLVLGSVFLVVTGGEALYADMGHFGRRPIKLTWFSIVLPALVLNYFGQGALIIAEPSAVEHPFFLMAPDWALYPLVALSTLATVIASQAVISGAFSLTRQAVQLGYLPRLHIEHTSSREIGQIYIPAVNWALMLASIGLVIGFRSSSNLASAYGVAVTTDMVFTTILFVVVARTLWRWSIPVLVLIGAGFLTVDLGFWGANIVKVPDGGWVPLVVAAFMFTIMTTWKRGRRLLYQRLETGSLPLETFINNVLEHPPIRVPGTAIFMSSNPTGTPSALLHNLKHNKVLHERVVFLKVVTNEVPVVAAEDRVDVESFGHNFYRITLHYGFTEDPDVPAALKKVPGMKFNIMDTTFFLGGERLIASSRRRGMALWREKLFVWMSQNARGATSFFCLPPNRVVEVGAQIEL